MSAVSHPNQQQVNVSSVLLIALIAAILVINLTINLGIDHHLQRSAPFPASPVTPGEVMQKPGVPVPVPAPEPPATQPHLAVKPVSGKAAQTIPTPEPVPTPPVSR
jgi:hypothetical protein